MFQNKDASKFKTIQWTHYPQNREKENFRHWEIIPIKQTPQPQTIHPTKRKSESSWSSRGSLEVRKCQFHSNSSEIHTELNEFTEVYKRSFCKETFLESQIRQFSENSFIWKWRICSGYSAKSYPNERDRHILIFGSMYETESKLSL